MTIRPSTMRVPALAAFLTAAVATTAVAAPAVTPCYTPIEVEAAEAIRFHTDLMLGGLTCQDTVRGRDTLAEYKAFTRKHQEALVGYERVLKQRFGRLLGGDPVAQLDTYRTELANRMAEETARVPITGYCAGQAAMLSAWARSDSDVLKDYARRRRHLEADRYEMCAGS